jgi:hypothetical protein
MEKRKELVAAMMASSILTLEQLMYEKVCNGLTEADTEGVIQDIFKFAKIYMALLNEDLSVLSDEEYAFLIQLESFAFTHGITS